MNYKFSKEIKRFSLDISDFDLISFFSTNLYRLAYFFDGDSYLGSLNVSDFVKNSFKFDKSLLKEDVIRDFYDVIKDHKKITSYFKKTKQTAGLVINNDEVIGEFLIKTVGSMSKSSQKKVDAFKKIGAYSELINKYKENNKDKKIGLLGSKFYDFSNPFFDVIEYKDKDNYDIILDCYFDYIISRDLEDKFIPMDEFLSTLLLNEIKDNVSLKDNLYFYSFDYIDESDLYPDEINELKNREDFLKTLENKEYIDKLYKDYPKDYSYITSLKENIHESVIVTNNGVYWENMDSIVPNDLREDRYREVPSYKESENTIYFYGPCIAYSLYTSKYSSIEEFVQGYLNIKRIDFGVMNYGAPTGTNFLNDLFTFIYNDNISNSIGLFFNQIGKHIKKYMLENGFKVIDANEYLRGHHYWFFNNELHLAPKGNRLIAELVIKTVDFSKKYVGENLSYLRKIKIDPSYYLVEHDVEGYKEYLRKNKFPNEGRIGMVEISANPFTNGHAYLIDYALKHCDYLYVFVVEDNRYGFPYYDRFMLIKRYCDKFPNVKVLEAGAFLGSKHTITAYFYRAFYIRFDAKEDVANFKNIYLPILDIDVRFMGEEKESEVTNNLNEAYIKFMSEIGKELIVIPRISYGGEGLGYYISAMRIRKAFKEKDFDYIKPRVPDFVYEYLLESKDDKIN